MIFICCHWYAFACPLYSSSRTWDLASVHYKRQWSLQALNFHRIHHEPRGPLSPLLGLVISLFTRVGTTNFLDASPLCGPLCLTGWAEVITSMLLSRGFKAGRIVRRRGDKSDVRKWRTRFQLIRFTFLVAERKCYYGDRNHTTSALVPG